VLGRTGAWRCRRLQCFAVAVFAAVIAGAAPRPSRAAPDTVDPDHRAAGATLEPEDAPGVVRAARRQQPIELDGRLDDAAWAAAPVYAQFVQLAPAEGRPPTERTELRVLYDDDALYVGVRCLDRTPDAIVRNLGRRDSDTASDSVAVLIDSRHDLRTAYVFEITAAGVLSDRLVYHDDQTTSEWDAVWEAAAAVDGAWWSAELRIPLHVMRFGAAALQTWGFTVQRTIARTHELVASKFQPRAAAGIASGLGTLHGLAALRPQR